MCIVGLPYGQLLLHLTFCCFDMLIAYFKNLLGAICGGWIILYNLYNKIQNGRWLLLSNRSCVTICYITTYNTSFSCMKYLTNHFLDINNSMEGQGHILRSRSTGIRRQGHQESCLLVQFNLTGWWSQAALAYAMKLYYLTGSKERCCNSFIFVVI